MSAPFVFKEFTVNQDQCAMKIGTDGVLLGAWAPLDHKPESILDIGAGTGLIALMLAQRSEATEIDGIELVDAAYEQCVNNFENAPWADRLFCYHAHLEELLEEDADSMNYDLIVSNPPFYTENNLKNEQQRAAARESSSLPFPLLLQAAKTLLSPKGLFALVLPFKEETAFVALAAAAGLFPHKIMRVQGHATAEIKRSYMVFGFEKARCRETALVIETARHTYTSEYTALVKDFYLKM